VTAEAGSGVYTVKTAGNAKIAALSPGGMVRYPDYSSTLLADVSSPAYRNACSAGVAALLAAKSATGAMNHAAPATRFDGVMFDDVNTSPQHGIDISEVGAYGPWKTDAQYGDDLIATVIGLATTAKTNAGRTVTIAANVGVSTWDTTRSVGRGVNPESKSTSSTGVQRAFVLADARMPARPDLPAVDIVVREFGVQWSNGQGLGNVELTSTMNFNRSIAQRGPRVLVHDYSVDLRQVGTTPYTTGAIVSNTAACLTTTSSGSAAIVAAAAARRNSDQALTQGFALMNRTGDITGIVASINQAQPFCQGGRSPEKVSTGSVSLTNSTVAALSAKLAAGVYRVGPVTTYGNTDIDTFVLSDGSTLFLNPDAAPVAGHPARSVTIR
jgi:hypothetical protein